MGSMNSSTIMMSLYFGDEMGRISAPFNLVFIRVVHALPYVDGTWGVGYGLDVRSFAMIPRYGMALIRPAIEPPTKQ
jgi:hypothetical protein